jgi:hypothetical protein
MLNKVIFSDNGTLYDDTAVLDDYVNSITSRSFVAAEDYIYIGSKYPITSKYIKNSGLLAQGTMSISYWDGSTWRSAVNVYDGTSVIGDPTLTMNRSGHISWETDKRYPWVKDDTTKDGVAHITGLGTMTLYDYYWIRLSFTDDFSYIWNWVGDLFCTDDDLGAEYADLTRTAVMSAFEASKQNWEEQRVQASKLVSQDLKRLVSLPGAAQVIGLDQLMLPCVSKTAEIIFRGLGSGYTQAMLDARKEYESRMDPRHFVIDQDANGRLDSSDAARAVVRRMSR